VAKRAVIGEAELLDALASARVVYVAERHDDPHHHAVQGRLLGLLHRAQPSLGIGLEMVKRPFQAPLTDYVEGRIDEAALLERTEWTRRWGYDFALYRPLLEYARAHRLAAFALNAPDELTRKVAREGLDALTPEERAQLPELDLSDAAHRAMVERAFAEHGGSHGGLVVERFYAAQVIWDETMAQQTAAALAAPSAPGRLLVLAGAGHLRLRAAVPRRAERRGAAPYAIIEPVTLGEDGATLDELLEGREADYLWVLSPQEEALRALDGPRAAE
jgi:aminopeptidase N